MQQRKKGMKFLKRLFKIKEKGPVIGVRRRRTRAGWKKAGENFLCLYCATKWPSTKYYGCFTDFDIRAEELKTFKNGIICSRCSQVLTWSEEENEIF